MEIEFSSKEWARVIYLMKRGLKVDPKNEQDKQLFWKTNEFAKQAKRDEDFSGDLHGLVGSGK